MLYERKLCNRLRTSEKSSVSVYRVHLVSINNVLMWICDLLYTIQRRFTTDY
jgi:hypothetical protein